MDDADPTLGCDTYLVFHRQQRACIRVFAVLTAVPIRGWPVTDGDSCRKYLTAVPHQPSFSSRQHPDQHRPGCPACQQVLGMTIVIIVGEQGYGGLFGRLRKCGSRG
jgi:hypothetical protein